MSSQELPLYFRHATETETYAPGALIFDTGDPGDAMFFVQEGEIALVVDGKEIDSARVGEFFGEMALIDKTTRTAQAIAKSESRLVRVDEKRFLFLVQQTPNFALYMMRVFMDRLQRRAAP